MEKSEQKGGFIHEGRQILLNIKKGAVPGPGSAEQDRVGLNRIYNDPEKTGREEPGGERQRQLRLTHQPEVPGQDWGLLFSLPASGVQFRLLPNFPGR